MLIVDEYNRNMSTLIRALNRTQMSAITTFSSMKLSSLHINNLFFEFKDRNICNIAGRYRPICM